MQGVVSKIDSKDFPNGKAWSFTLSGDRTFYRLGQRPPTFSEGDSVRFDTAQKGNSTYANNVVPWKENGVAVPTSTKPDVVARAATTAFDKESYWANKEARDVGVQARIELQSCRNSSIELVRLLLSTGVEAVKLPAAQAKKEQVVALLVSKYTADFLAENKAGGPKVDEPVDTKVAVEAATPIPVEGDRAEDWN